MKKAFNEIDIAQMIEALRYDNGAVYWNERPLSHFTSERIMKGWNKKHAGKEAFTSINSSNGYKQGNFNGKRLLRCWAIFALHNGRMPTYVLKRRGYDRTDDRIENLYEHKPRQVAKDDANE